MFSAEMTKYILLTLYAMNDTCETVSATETV